MLLGRANIKALKQFKDGANALSIFKLRIKFNSLFWTRPGTHLNHRMWQK
jgi:hypothetical protein